MNSNLKKFIALDFLSRFTKVDEFSRYSPTVEEVLTKANSTYPNPGAGFYQVSAESLLEAAVHLEIAVRLNNSWVIC